MSDFEQMVTTDPVLFVGYTIEGEWPVKFGEAGQFLVALCMALRIERWKHDIHDIKREWFGWKQDRPPSDNARYLAERVMDGRLLNLMFCFSRDDVERILPQRGYTPGEADFVYPDPDATFGLRLYCDNEGWQGKERENG